MKLHKYILALGVAAIVLPTASFAQEDGLVREVIVYTGNTFTTPGIIRGAKALDVETWATPSDFPEDVPFKPLRVSAGIVLALDAEGKVQSCRNSYTAVDRSENRDLTDWTAAACMIVERSGKFTYALDAAGKRAQSETNMTVTFETKKEGARAYIPPPSPPPASSFYQRRAKPKKELKLKLRDPAITNATPRVWLDINSGGKVTACRISASTGSDQSDAAVCTYLTKQKFVPAIDRMGSLVAESYFRVDLPITRK